MIVSGGALLGMATVSLSLVLSPGPNMIYLVSRSITQGRAAGLISLAGVGAGFLAYLTMAVAGVSAIFTTFPPAFVALKLAGAGYLLYLAWNSVRPGVASPFAPRALAPDGRRRLFTMGLVTNLLNPKIAVLYVALLPQFVDPQRGLVALQSVVLGGTQIAIALTVNALIVLFAGSLATFLATRPGWLRAQKVFMGAVLGILAVTLLTTPAIQAVPA